ncbi:MAG TPA: methyltransferase domain-containing protein [Chloroflexia bacterium]|nr:methyltransferase domain-containing protein [Chloroflexia bacterium]
MLIEEARWLEGVLKDIGPGKDWTVLDIGSSTEYFRRVDQPYIDYFVFRPLRKLGAKVLHVDSREGEGIDVRYDISDPASPDVEGKIPRGRIVLCCNLLEHVRDRQMVVRRLHALTEPGGYLVVTVPHVYRYHEDPIDTMYRPDNAELEGLFSGLDFETVRSTVLDVECGYVTFPQALPAYILYRLRSFVKYRILKHKFEPERCKVAAVVLRKRGTLQTDASLPA